MNSEMITGRSGLFGVTSAARFEGSIPSQSRRMAIRGFLVRHRYYGPPSNFLKKVSKPPSSARNAIGPISKTNPIGNHENHESGPFCTAVDKVGESERSAGF